MFTLAIAPYGKNMLVAKRGESPLGSLQVLMDALEAGTGKMPSEHSVGLENTIQVVLRILVSTR